MCGVSRFAVDFPFLFGVLFAGMDAELCEKRYRSRERNRAGLGSKKYLGSQHSALIQHQSLVVCSVVYRYTLQRCLNSRSSRQLASIGLFMGLFSVCDFHVGLLSLFRAVSGIWQGNGGWPLKAQTQSAVLLVAKRNSVGASACLMELWRIEHLNNGEEEKRCTDPSKRGQTPSS
ncbi:hypothetical protein Ddc_05475 [Ditylenchus destructor]|nr:hypothetical protein Ddc_05475 [Ditylenchus destructor]